MDTLSREELRYLVQIRQNPCLSIFLPTHRSGREIEEDRIRLKTLLRDARSRLDEMGVPKRTSAEVLAPTRPLTEGGEFWHYQSDGLGLFLAPGYFRYFRVPVQLQEFMAAADRFDITPLLPLWTLEDRFHLLAISRNRVRLFEGTRFDVHEMHTNSIPKSFNEALDNQVDQSHREQHTAKPGLPKDLLLYFRSIDRGLRTLLNAERIPLVLAGVEESLSFYRQVNTYEGLLPVGIVGNPDRLSAAEIHAKAWEIVQAHYDMARKMAIRQYTECADPARISSNVAKIVPAACHGRVYHLYVALGAAVWGECDLEQETVTVHDEARPGDENLVNVAVVQTIMNGGSVYALPPDKTPEGAAVAALFRY